MKEIGLISREQALTAIEPKQAVSGPVTCMNAEKMHDRTTDGLISRQAAIDAPTIDPVRKGRKINQHSYPAKWLCSECGAKHFDFGDKFCSKCGANVEGR